MAALGVVQELPGSWAQRIPGLGGSQTLQLLRSCSDLWLGCRSEELSSPLKERASLPAEQLLDLFISARAIFYLYWGSSGYH